MPKWLWWVAIGVGIYIVYDALKKVYPGQPDLGGAGSSDFWGSPAPKPDWYKNDPFYSDPDQWRKDLEEKIRKFKEENPEPKFDE